MPRTNSDLRSSISDIITSFCGDDLGRSVTFASYAPAIPNISIRGNQARPAASVMKVPLAMAVLKSAAQNKIDLDARIPVSKFASTRYVSILAAFDPGRELSIREVCRLTLMTSDNPLTVYLQTLVDFETVNRLLQGIGCGPQCRMAAGFTEPELGSTNRANTLTSDAAVKILSAVSAGPIYRDLTTALQNNLRNNRIPALLPENAVVIHKTGGLDGVANDVGIVYDDRISFTIAFLTDNQPNVIQTTNDIARCAQQIFNRLSGA